MSRRQGLAAAVLAAGACAFAVVPSAPRNAGAAPAGLQQVEAEFEAAVRKMELATVVVVPRDGSSKPAAGGCSGVLVSARGLILTSSLAGTIPATRERKEERVDTVHVRVPDAKKGAFTNYRGTVVYRSPESSVAVVALEKPPAAGFAAYLVPSRSDGLAIGSFAFATGNSFGHSDEGTPTLTAGLVVGVERNAAGGGTTDLGAFRTVFTSAAVNPGVEGGPFVDVHGRLVGVIAGSVDPVRSPESPFQFMGRVIAMDRVRAALAGCEEIRPVFAANPPPPLKADESAALEVTFSRASAAVWPGIASLEIARTKPVSAAALSGPGKAVELPRYQGPVPAIIASEGGLIVTALYNVTNVQPLKNPILREALPESAQVRTGLAQITGATAHFANGTAAPCKLVAVHEGLGVALFRAELPAGTSLTPAVAAPAASLAAGRFVVAVANPFGAAKPGAPPSGAAPDAFVTVGILSKRHADDAVEPWRGHWQTDARTTDGNCGGAATDLQGRLLGMMNLWDVAQQGRASGIAFVTPWEKIAAALPGLATGTSVRRPFLGIRWAQDPDSVKVLDVVEGAAAHKAGIRKDDVILAIGGRETKSADDVAPALAPKNSGDTVKIRIRRGTDTIELDVVLGGRD